MNNSVGNAKIEKKGPGLNRVCKYCASLNNSYLGLNGKKTNKKTKRNNKQTKQNETKRTNAKKKKKKKKKKRERQREKRKGTYQDWNPAPSVCDFMWLLF